MAPLNLFYAHPNDDRWLYLDRYPRAIVRRVVHGKPTIGGHQRVFLNLCAGLDRIGVAYRVNDYSAAKREPHAVVGIVGKPFLLDRVAWRNPIVFGAAGYSHPSDDPDLLSRLPVTRVLVPCEWMRTMCEPYWGERVCSWPVGIETEKWRPDPAEPKDVDVLIYDKVRWDHDDYEKSLLAPLRKLLGSEGRSFLEIRYGCYRENEFREALRRCKTMVFICEHETQGIAYQQALSAGVPILAWDRRGPWRDPAYYPHKAVFSPVTAVPYWDDRCGRTFADAADLASAWRLFWDDYKFGRYSPRDYILENLTLEKCANEYVALTKTVER